MTLSKVEGGKFASSGLLKQVLQFEIVFVLRTTKISW